jgi:hypothetical protein
MASDELVKKLKKLSGQERRVLQLRCQALSDKAISTQTDIPLPSVKTYLSRAYVKVDVDTLEKLFRWKVLFSEVCPALSELDIPPAPEPRNLKPAPDNVVRKVEEDDEILARFGDRLPEILDYISLPPPRSTRGRWLIATMLLLCLLFLVDAGVRFGVFRNSGLETPVPTSAQQSPIIILPTPHALPTNIPVVQTVIMPQTVVVTQVVPQTVFAEQTVIITQTVVVTAATQSTTTAISEITQTPTPISALSTLYEADWSEGLNGWPSTFGWKTLNGMLLNDGSNTEGPSWKSRWIAAPFQPSEADYAIEAEIQLIGNSGCGGFGIVARGSYQGGAYACGNQRAYIASKDGDIVKEQDFSRGSDWHTYRFEVQGNTLRLKIDGSVIVEVTDNRYLDSGMVGLWSDRNQINVRSYKVLRLE